jgi:FhaA, N-terminal domain/FHA domain
MVLRGIEQRLERIFEGVFGRAFRTNVQPVELARKLAKEMDDHRSASVRNVYVPNEYTIYLSPGDREQFEGYENSLVSELEEYLSEHAQRENYALLTPPRILFETDEDLGVGEFGIATRMAQYGRKGEQEEDAPPAASAPPGATMIYKPRTQPTEAASLAELGVEREVAVLSWNGQRRVLDKKRSVLGRSRDVDVQIEDPNISRRHAEIVQEGSAYWLVDLGSTNGTEVDGRRVQRARLDDGSRFTVGETTVTFSTERE